jgi:polyferredoxin
MSSDDKKSVFTSAQLKKRNERKNEIVRRIIQLIYFISMPSAFAVGFTGVKYIFMKIGNGETLEVNSFIKALLGLGIFTIIFGRYFCGYICAFGSLGDFIYWLSGRLQIKVLKRKKQIKIPDKATKRLQKIKYIVLAAIIILCTAGVYGKISGCSPWDVFSRLVSFTAVPSGYVIGIIIFILIIIGMAFRERFFCQILCPMGALFSILPILPWSLPNRKKDECISGCKACLSKCPVALKPEQDGYETGECIACGKCAFACPHGNIYSDSSQIINALALVIVKAILFFILGVWLGFFRFF